ncbi:MAG TPA: vWA domain-containing protein [Ktedonobacteraceae bacterium]|jgi:hypothetical protein|nr:vWA domain-containing protein [Ktedonobacteraceae bacterium]
MEFTRPATVLTPALVVYLIDASHSMNEAYGTMTRMDVVNDALKEAMKAMVRRSVYNGVVQRRYKLAILAYTTKVVDVLGGIRDLPEVIKRGVPVISAGGETDTAGAFKAVEALLRQHLSEYQTSPAPLVCHFTDALLNSADPAPVVRRIQALRVQDGPVLVENVYIAEKVFRKPVEDWHQWRGVVKANQLSNDYARLLYRLSSPLPETYRQNINEAGYHLQKGAALFFSGTHMDFIRLALPISAATQAG